VHISRFLWEEERGKKKYHLVGWDIVCIPKDQGGLGILNLDLMNISLLRNGFGNVSMRMAFGNKFLG
jgi:hypothetical protein